MRTMFGVQLIDRKSDVDLMLMLALSETMDQLSMINSVHWYGYVLRNVDVQVFRRALGIEVADQRKMEKDRKRSSLRMKV